MRTFAKLLAFGAAAVLLVVAGCTNQQAPPPADTSSPGTSSPEGSTPSFTTERIASLVQGLPQQSGAQLGAKRLADGLVPPTNKWFSGLVFGEEHLPVFPMPLSFALMDEGFSFGVPQVTTSESAILGPHTPDVTATMEGAQDWKLTAYDDATITVASEQAEITLAQGSPVVAFTARQDVTLRLGGSLTQEDGYQLLTQGERRYALVGEVEAAEGGIRVAAGKRATWVAIPDGAEPADIVKLANPVTGSEVSHSQEGHKVTTSIGYTTENGEPTLFVAMPHHTAAAGDMDCDLGSYRSAYGELKLCSGKELVWSSPTYEARPSIDVSGLDESQAEELRKAVAEDVANLDVYPADTYFGGKALLRDAQLAALARDLGMDVEAKRAHEHVLEQFRIWMEPKGCDERDAFCFAYDTDNRGVVGHTPSFGSEEYNDHHFHYGYFLYTGALLAERDPALAEEFAPVLDALAADIASDVANEQLPVRRNFDVYASHGWASGTAPFADGNNQESSSEAVTAWAGLTLWGKASGNAPLEAQGRWMHALEAQAARAYWTDFDLDAPVYEGFKHKVLSLNFGAKRDYATWFSAEPAAKLAILIIPASPSSDHLAGEPERIRANVEEGLGGKGYDQQYGEFILMYKALAGDEDKAEALEIARGLPKDKLDDGMTYSYLLTWIMTA